MLELKQYTKLIPIIGEVGGFIEVLFTLFRVFSSFSVDILYEISLVNELFDFNLDKKEIVLKKLKNLKENNYPKEEDHESNNNFEKSKKMKFRISTLPKETMLIKDNKINDEENLNKSQKTIKFSKFKKDNNNNGKSNSNIFLKAIQIINY